MKKVIFSIFVFAALFVLNKSEILACTCVPLPEDITIEQQVKEAYQTSSSVFIGEVIEVTQKPDDEFYVTVRFKVDKIWNDKKFQKEITLSTGKDDGLCGYSFERGEKYLVYASGESNKLSTNICTRTAPAESNKDEAILNKLKKPRSSPK